MSPFLPLKADEAPLKCSISVCVLFPLSQADVALHWLRAHGVQSVSSRKGGPQKAKQLPDFVSGYNRTLRSEWGVKVGATKGTDVPPPLPHPLVLLLLHTLAWKRAVS